MSWGENGDEPLVIRLEDLEEEFEPPRLVVELTDESSSAEPAPSPPGPEAHDAGVPLAPAESPAQPPVAAPIAPPPAKTFVEPPVEPPVADPVAQPPVAPEVPGPDLSPEPVPVPPEVPAAAPAGGLGLPSIELPKVASPPVTVAARPRAPRPEPPPAPEPIPPPSAASLLAVEAPIFTAESTTDDLPAVAAFIDRFDRPPLGQLIDDEGRLIGPRHLDLQDIAVDLGGSRLATSARWSQTVFGLDPVADYVLQEDPDMGAMDPGPYTRYVPVGPQLGVGELVVDGSAIPSDFRTFTAVPLSVEAPAWSPDGQRIAVLERRGTAPSAGPPLVLREVSLTDGAVAVLAAVPPTMVPGGLARLAYSPCGRFLLLSGTRAASVLDLQTAEWVGLPLASVAWAPARSASTLIGAHRANASDPTAPALELCWFDLATWTTEPIGPVHGAEAVGGLYQLDLSSDGRFLAAATRFFASDAETAYLISVVDLDDLTLDEMTPAAFDGLVGVRRAQQSPNWVHRPAPAAGSPTIAEQVERIAADRPDGDALDREFADELDLISEGFYLTATDPTRPGACAREAELFTRRAIAVAGLRPWLEARLKDLPDAVSPPELTSFRGPSGAPTLEAAVRTARAANALSDGDIEEAEAEWSEALATDQLALLSLHQLDDAAAVAAGTAPDMDLLVRAAQGPDRRLSTEARLKRAYLEMASGLDARAELDALAADPDPWYAARAQPIAAYAHLQQDSRPRCEELLALALAGPQERAARSAADLVTHLSLADDHPLWQLVARLGEPTE